MANEELKDSGIVTALSVTGLVFGLVGMIWAFIPLLGWCAYYVGIPATLISGLALGVAFSQKAKRTFAIVALTISLIGVVISGIQHFSIVSAYKKQSSHENRTSEKQIGRKIRTSDSLKKSTLLQVDQLDLDKIYHAMTLSKDDYKKLFDDNPEDHKKEFNLRINLEKCSYFYDWMLRVYGVRFKELYPRAKLDRHLMVLKQMSEVITNRNREDNNAMKVYIYLLVVTPNKLTLKGQVNMRIKPISTSWQLVPSHDNKMCIIAQLIQPQKPSDDIEIPSLNAKVTELRFFEKGNKMPTFGQRGYKRQFPNSSSRYINWEINLEHPKPNRRIDFEITAIYYRSDGSMLAQQTKNSYIKPGWTTSYHSLGWGWSKPGNWEVGTYSVDLFIKGQKIASGTFEIN
ncbi:MAG: hypothetical protein NUV40_03195 [Patescibacteria group bacterium]|nr:hypothetical protein [Patescibacteria group bacterium]